MPSRSNKRADDEERYTRIVEFLKEARKRSRLTQKEVCDTLGLYPNLLTKVETGERKLDIVEFLDLCTLYRCDMAKILKAVRNHLHSK